MSHQEISEGRDGLRLSGPRALVPRAFRYLPRGLVFSRVYRLPRAPVNSRDYSRQPRKIGRRYTGRLIKLRRIRYAILSPSTLSFSLPFYSARATPHGMPRLERRNSVLSRAISTEIIIVIKAPRLLSAWDKFLRVRTRARTRMRESRARFILNLIAAVNM